MASVTAPALRPQGMGQLLDQAIRVYRRNFLKFIGVIAVAQVPVTTLGLLLSLAVFWNAASQQQAGPYSNPALASATLFGAQFYANLISTLVMTVVGFFLIQGVATAALTRAVADHYLGRPAGFLGAYRRLGRGWLRLIGALLFAILLYLALVFWLLIPCIGWLTGVGMLLFFGQAVIPLVAPIVVLEKQSVLGSIRRAWDLARRRFWWVLGFVAILYVFSQLIVAGPGYLLSILLQMWASSSAIAGNYQDTYIIQTVVQSLVTMALSLVYLPLQLTAITLLYVDLRVRTEGFDLLWRAEGMLREGALPADLLPQAPPPGGEGLVNWKEIGYCAGLSIGLVFLLFVFYMVLAFLLGLLFLSMAI
jgi:hypothetical protein